MKLKQTLSGILAATMIATPVLPAYAQSTHPDMPAFPEITISEEAIGEDVNAASVTDPKENLWQINNSSEYVTWLYYCLLEREPDSAGLRAWVRALANGKETASSVFVKFAHSAEFETATFLDDYTFADRVHHAIHAPVNNGIWLAPMVHYHVFSREDILEELSNSTELAEICKTAGIRQGTYKADPNKDLKYRTYNLVYDLYGNILHREPDEAGFNAWTNALLSGKKTVSQVIRGFLKSSEIQWEDNDISNEDFVETVFNLLFLPKSGYQHQHYYYLQSIPRPYYEALQAGRNRWDVLNDIFNLKMYHDHFENLGFRF